MAYVNAACAVSAIIFSIDGKFPEILQSYMLLLKLPVLMCSYSSVMIMKLCKHHRGLTPFFSVLVKNSTARLNREVLGRQDRML